MKKKVMVVDDQAEFANLLQKAWPEWDLQIESDPSSALDAARHFRPDLIVLDLVMPELAGFELAGRLHDDPRLCLTPIIILSALVDRPLDENRPVLIQGYPAFGKPFRIDALHRFIAHVLSEQDAEQPPFDRLQTGTLAGQAKSGRSSRTKRPERRS